MRLANDTHDLAQRVERMAILLISVERAIAADMADALRGTSKSERRGPAKPCCEKRERGEDCGCESPTGHHDPTGDIATSGAVAAVEKRRSRIQKALHDAARAVLLAERAIRAEATTPEPWTETKTAELCATDTGYCSRLKEPGSDLCLECGQARDRLERDKAPRCWSCSERPVESWRNAKGEIMYRRMTFDEARNDWVPLNEGPPPQCEACRRQTDRAA